MGPAMFSFRDFWRRLGGLKSGTTRSRSISRNRLPTNPPRHGHPEQWRFHGSICLSAMPNSPFIARRVWIAAALSSDRRPRLPVGAASQVMAGSNQPYGDCGQSPTGQWIVSDPRRLSASFYAGRFLVLQAGGVGLLMQPSYHTGFTR